MNDLFNYNILKNIYDDDKSMVFKRKLGFWLQYEKDLILRRNSVGNNTMVAFKKDVQPDKTLYTPLDIYDVMDIVYSEASKDTPISIGDVLGALGFISEFVSLVYNKDEDRWMEV